MFTFDRMLGAADCCPWGSTIGRRESRNLVPREALSPKRGARPLYTPEQRHRRDASRWTLVQGILAPFQFAVFVVSLSLVVHYLMTGQGLAWATASVIVKTLTLYTIMVTGAIWERDVFGRYLFAPAFYWEDVVSMLVIALHTAYVVALISGAIDTERQMWLALTAYGSYVVNATQFILKLRAARKQEAVWPAINGAMGHFS